MCFRVRFFIKQVVHVDFDVLMLAKIIVTFGLSVTSIAYYSSVNNFVTLWYNF